MGTRITSAADKPPALWARHCEHYSDRPQDGPVLVCANCYSEKSRALREHAEAVRR